MNISRYAMHEVWLCKNVPDVFTLVEFDNTQGRTTHTTRQRTDTDPHTHTQTDGHARYHTPHASALTPTDTRTHREGWNGRERESESASKLAIRESGFGKSNTPLEPTSAPTRRAITMRTLATRLL